MTRRHARQAAGDPVEDHDIGSAIVEEFLDGLRRLDPGVVQLFLLTALPHWVDLAVVEQLRSLLPECPPSEKVMSVIASSPFVRKHSTGGFVFHETVRPYLVAKVRRDTPNLCADAHGKLASHYRKEVASCEQPGLVDLFRREMVFHLLGADEQAGLAALAEAYSYGEEYCRVGLCSGLVTVFREQANTLSRETGIILDLYQGKLAYLIGDWRAARESLARVGPGLAEVPNWVRAQYFVAQGLLDRAVAEWDSAISNLNNALGLLGEARSRDRGAILNELGLIHYRRGDWGQAAGLLRESLDLVTSDLDANIRGEVLHNLGKVLYRQGFWEEAGKHVLESQRLFERTGNAFSAAWAKLVLSRIHRRLRQYERALSLCTESLDTFSTLGSSFGVGRALHLVGECHFHMGRLKEAENAFERGLDIKRTLGDRDGEEPRRRGHWLPDVEQGADEANEEQGRRVPGAGEGELPPDDIQNAI